MIFLVLHGGNHLFNFARMFYNIKVTLYFLNDLSEKLSCGSQKIL